MSDSAHLLIPFASCRDEGCREALATLELPRLEKLLARLAPGAPDAGDETTLSMPHERVLARACGIDGADGRIPWAAWQVKQSGRDPQGQAWAQITPCHWRVGSDHVAMDDPRELALEEGESRAVLATMQPFFEEDGIALEYAAPTLWLARGEAFRDLPTASLDRVIGRPVDRWLPRVAGAGPLRRLQQEMQMLLYADDAHEARQRRGLAPVNSFWISGTGALPAGPAAAQPAPVQVTDALRQPALQGDWAAWAAAWRQLDAEECAGLLEALAAGRPVTLTLCGERSAQCWSSEGGAGWRRRMRGLFAGGKALPALEPL